MENLLVSEGETVSATGISLVDSTIATFADVHCKGGCSSNVGMEMSLETFAPANIATFTGTTEVEGLLTPCTVCGEFVAITTKYVKSGTVIPNQAMIYEFEIPQDDVGRLIGRHGTFVKQVKEATGVNVIVKQHHTSSIKKICAIEGTPSEIKEAIAMIRARFPVKRYPFLMLEQVTPPKPTPQILSMSFLLSNNELSLGEGVLNDVTVSYAMSLDRIFLQQPSHPTYPGLSRLHQDIKCTYEQPGVPQLVRPFNIGVVCVTRLRKDEWYRIEVVAVQHEKDQVTARLVDIGGYVQVPIDDLRQIKVSFLAIPFQAAECKLANVVPCNDEEGWSEEANNFFKVMTHGKVLQAQVVGYSTTDRSTLIYLYRLNENNTLTMINKALVTHGYGKWIGEVQQILEPDIRIYSEIEETNHKPFEWEQQSGGYYIPNSIDGTTPYCYTERNVECIAWTNQSGKFDESEGFPVEEQALLSDHSDAPEVIDCTL